MENLIKEFLNDNLSTVKQLLNDPQVADIKHAADEILRAVKRGSKIIVFGNGGSAADAQHMAAEFVGRFRKEREPLPAICLSCNTSSLTAISNDYGYENSFKRQLEAFASKGDVAIAISTSGNSKNCLEALKCAKKLGLKTVVLTGKTGGQLAKISDISVIVPGEKTSCIQEAHILIIHIICAIVDEGF